MAPWKVLFLLGCGFIAGMGFQARCQTVVDGDTIHMGGTTWRLHGIDAPEKAQACPNGFLAGEYATAVLRGLMEGHNVLCVPRDTDRYGRTVAVCYADGLDVGGELVRLGLAWAFVRYSRDYAAREQQAKATGLGIHGAGCQPAWQYRSEKR